MRCCLEAIRLNSRIVITIYCFETLQCIFRYIFVVLQLFKLPLILSLINTDPATLRLSSGDGLQKGVKKLSGEQLLCGAADRMNKFSGEVIR